MMASKNGVGQIIKACVTGVTLIALPGGFRIIKAALDDLFGFTRWTCYAVWPAQLAYSLITLTIIDQILDVNLHRWTPVRVWDMGWYQCTPSSKSTTLESNMSLHLYRQSLLYGQIFASGAIPEVHPERQKKVSQYTGHLTQEKSPVSR